MSLPLVWRSPAHTEFEEAALWYETKRADLGVDFVNEVQLVLDKIARQPDRYPLAFADIREAPVSRFPYCVYYRVKPDWIVVLAIFHSARDPRVWQSRR
ncbi:MAG TPA: type II toxin-antitoxin system RelE/ParE family toxin [Gemmataceae bacterium]|nr:type II toxin-antitoxin system RelE/ParE family toxin [Gemmataceae bacterium]